MRAPLFSLLVLLVAAVHLPQPLRAQSAVESEDLAPPAPTTTVADEIAPLLEHAELVFASADQPDSIALLSDIIDRLETELGDTRAVAQLVRALSLRAQAHFNLGDRTAATADLERLIVLAPSSSFDPSSVSPKLVQLAAEVADRRVGRLRVALDPSDAKLEIGGVTADPSQPIALLAGTVEVRASRPGFAAATHTATIAPGVTSDVAITLERSSAVLWIRTRPVGVTVKVDDQSAGVTVAPEAGDPLGESVAIGVEVGLGPHVIEASLADHRPQRLSVNVPGLGDYRLEAIALERAEALVRLSGLTGGQVFVDGRATESRQGVLRLAPGRRRIAVDGGVRGQFEATVELADRQNLDLEVALRPALALAGILGGDRVAADRVAGELRNAFGGGASWTLLDRNAEGSRALGNLGVDASVLRTEAGSRRLDWSAIQRSLDALSPATLHLLGALSDDLVANAVELVFLPAAPAAALPERRHLVIGDPTSRAALLEGLDTPIRFEKPTLGLELVDGLEGVLVVNVRPGSPAERAGIRAGELVTSLGGTAVIDRAGLLGDLHQRASGPVSLALRDPSGATRSIDLGLELRPATARPDQPRLLYSALAARTVSARAEARVPAWVLDLNEAIVLLHARALEDAIRRLRTVEAPSAAGLGKEATEYWLGVALAAAGPTYHQAARDAFERATRRPDATFDDADGPFVAPAARARLAAMGSASPSP